MTAKYNAFISYRHNERDTLVASTVQTQLERFHIPKAIQKKTGIEKIDRIFREQNELELTSDLASDIDTALAQSDFLIVILSPAYNESKWCLHEIEQFLKTHDSDRIMAVLSQGEPPGVFPEILMRRLVHVKDAEGNETIETHEAEPLACDYRMDFRKARRFELPRLVSGMLGCEYDDLVMRNETYRRNRMISAFSFIGVLAVSAIAWLLYSNSEISRNYRQSQIHESKRIASQALEDLSEGMRLDAVQESISALPSEDHDRPVTSEALYALSKSSLAYQLPYHIVETDVIDLSMDIRTMRIDEAHHLLYLIDSENTVHIRSADTLEETASFTASGTIENWRPEIRGGRFYFWSKDGVICMDSSGTSIWKQTMRFDTYGTVAVSSDGSSIAAADVSAVEIMRTDDGTPVASFLVAKDNDYYVYDICWSKDDSHIGVLLRDSTDGTYAIGMLEPESGGFTFLSQIDKPEKFEFISGDTLVVLSCPGENRTMHQGDDLYLYDNELDVTCYTPEGELWKTAVPFTMENTGASIIPALDQETPFIIISASDTLTLLDPSSGDTLMKRQVGCSILSAFDFIGNAVFLITADGHHGTVWLNSSDALMDRMFPDDISEAAVYHGFNAILNQYAILREGNVYWYASAYDSDLSVFEGTGFYDPADEGVIGADSIAVRSQNTVFLYDRATGKELSSLTCRDDELLYLLRTTRPLDNLGLLRTDMTTGDITLELYSMHDLSLVKQIPLARKDAYALTKTYAQIDDLFFSNPYSRKNLMMSSFYSAPASVIALHDEFFYYLEGSAQPSIHRVSLIDGTEETIRISMDELLNADLSENSSDTPKFTLSQDGTRGMIAVRSADDEAVHPLVFDTATGQARLIKDTLSYSLCFAVNEAASRYAFCGVDNISLYDGNLRKIAEIPYPGSTCSALFFDDQNLYAVYPEGRLDVYGADGSLINTITLSSITAQEFGAADYRLIKDGRTLLIFEGEQLEFASLDEMASLPEACVPERALAYDSTNGTILVYTYDGTAKTSLFYPGLLPRYSADDLIRKGREELR